MQRISKRYGVPLLIFICFESASAKSVEALIEREEKIRQEMVVISRELGVTCTECHKVTNFRDNSKQTFKVSLEHMKLTQMLKEKGFDGKKGPAATCYMCHRGKLQPDYKEPASAKAH